MLFIAPKFNEFSDCAAATTNPGWTISGAYANSANVTSEVISNKLTSARTSFSITWSVSKPVWSFSKFELSIGTLGSAIKSFTDANKGCRVYNIDGTLSFDFTSITSDLSSTITLTPYDLSTN